MSRFKFKNVHFQKASFNLLICEQLLFWNTPSVQSHAQLSSRFEQNKFF